MRRRFKARSHQTSTSKIVHPTKENRLAQLQECVPGLLGESPSAIAGVRTRAVGATEADSALHRGQ
jgi:hypothetical protein